MMDSQRILDQIQKHAFPLDDDQDLDPLVEAIGDASIVLLGESTHGTSEFYKVRAELSKRLIEQKGFSFLAVEGDWPSCFDLNRYIKQHSGVSSDIDEVMQSFNRWPTWMWANRETAELMQWLRSYNDQHKENQVGFYGLDVYSLWESMEEIIRYLERMGSGDVELAKQAFACFEPFSRSEQTYGVSAAFLSEDCEKEVVQLLQEMRANRHQYGEEEATINMELNALVAVNAERYYRAMVRGGPESWNIRDQHMVQVLSRLMKFHGPQAKTIVWEHNTHIGDARATDMVKEGMVNVGQLIREQEGPDKVFAVGFGTHHGSVIAARAWGVELERMSVPRAVPNSWEDLMHRANSRDQILIFRDHHESYRVEIDHRAIGVVYHPEDERYNYVPSIMSERYDAFVYLDETHALEPIPIQSLVYS
ncbi:erythromycin esterase family protein [Ammoniphilus sp. CFH 90114]|uniref:erythromycin esterase family protein n=1 Tax=Ammoniphilus sp. CFH 90114 TaxID=2493665 RepID=UPI00100E2B16|nr:erythromycin esterase family protein [Ammoniphilus sp. CFH 90114]RXT07794.1 erythromycin esterase family protein [Ammoniphilus sp. CFH 90114]